MFDPICNTCGVSEVWVTDSLALPNGAFAPIDFPVPGCHCAGDAAEAAYLANSVYLPEDMAA